MHTGKPHTPRRRRRRRSVGALLAALVAAASITIAVTSAGTTAQTPPGGSPGGPALPTLPELPEIPVGQLPDLPGLPDVPDTGGIWNFQLTDDPGNWFDSGLNLFGTKSLGVSVDPLTKVTFTNSSQYTETNHTASSLMWPKGASGMPFDQDKAWKNGSVSTTLKDPGLYAFVCKLHPFMLGAVIVDDPTTVGLDVGKEAEFRDGRTFATHSDLYWRIIRAFFVVTNPSNWQEFKTQAPTEWDPSYAVAPLLAYDKSGKKKLISNLDSYFQTRFKEPQTLPAANTRPDIPGIGEVWINNQYEKTAGKTKPSTVTAVDAKSWQVTKKFGLPGANLNNAHNMWTDKDHTKIYTTEWFSDALTTFDPDTGDILSTTKVGEAPAHVMTRTDTDQIHVGINGEDYVSELAPGGAKVDREIPTQFPGEQQSQPHAHWMSSDGKVMVTPNSNTDDSTQVDVPSGTITKKPATGKLPIAAAVSGDGTKYYVSNFLEASVTCVSMDYDKPACNDGKKKVTKKKIDLFQNYDPISGKLTGAMGGLPIQTPVSPDGKYVMQANTLTATVTIIDTDTDKLVKALPCDAGCHGINFGAKKGGGWYAYVSNKFANTMNIVDPDPNGDGEPLDAKVVGRVILNAESATKMDDEVTEYAGMGGQGVMPLPLAYNGWVQQVPNREPYDELTCEQRNPIDQAACK